MRHTLVLLLGLFSLSACVLDDDFDDGYRTHNEYREYYPYGRPDYPRDRIYYIESSNPCRSGRVYHGYCYLRDDDYRRARDWDNGRGYDDNWFRHRSEWCDRHDCRRNNERHDYDHRDNDRRDNDHHDNDRHDNDRHDNDRHDSGKLFNGNQREDSRDNTPQRPEQPVFHGNDDRQRNEGGRQHGRPRDDNRRENDERGSQQQHIEQQGQPLQAQQQSMELQQQQMAVQQQQMAVRQQQEAQQQQ
ncbi:MAG TPA: hypothetical protein PLF22_11470, partial [Pseudomonadales bacterium]|nr:hypothetical protein [Pseudomonadales bacterium]